MTIKERAEQYLNEQIQQEDFGCSGGFDEIKQAYHKGATEQREIDIQRAVEYLCGECTSKCEHICMMCNRKNELIKAMKGE